MRWNSIRQFASALPWRTAGATLLVVSALLSAAIAQDEAAEETEADAPEAAAPETPPAPAPRAAPAPRVAAPAEDAEYRVLSPNATLLKERVKENNVKAQVKNVLAGRQALADNQVYFDAWYKGHYFPLMTQTSEQSLKNLPEERFRFLRDLEDVKDADVHEHLVDLALTTLTPVVQDNFHPVVRYNALLLLGAINQQEAVRIGAGKDTPEPHARALPLLVTELTRAENTDLLRTAALLGVVRHMEWDAYRENPLPAPLRASAVTALLDLATQKTPPANRTPGGQNWMRRRAIEGLGFSCAGKAEQNILDALVKLVSDDDDSLDVRSGAAMAIGHCTIAAPAKLDLLTTSKELGHLAVMICQSELKRVSDMQKEEEERQEYLAGGAGGSSSYGSQMGSTPSSFGPRPPRGGGMGGMLGDGGLLGGAGAAELDPKSYRVEPARRRMRARLYGVQVAIKGPADDKGITPRVRGLENVAKAQPEKTSLANVLKTVDAVALKLEESDASMKALSETVNATIKSLDDMTKRPKAPAAAGADLPGGDSGEPDANLPGGKAASGKKGKAGASPRGKTKTVPGARPIGSRPAAR